MTNDGRKWWSCFCPGCCGCCQKKKAQQDSATYEQLVQLKKSCSNVGAQESVFVSTKTCKDHGNELCQIEKCRTISEKKKSPLKKAKATVEIFYVERPEPESQSFGGTSTFVTSSANNWSKSKDQSMVTDKTLASSQSMFAPTSTVLASPSSQETLAGLVSKFSPTKGIENDSSLGICSTKTGPTIPKHLKTERVFGKLKAGGAKTVLTMMGQNENDDDKTVAPNVKTDTAPSNESFKKTGSEQKASYSRKIKYKKMALPVVDMKHKAPPPTKQLPLVHKRPYMEGLGAQGRDNKEK